MRTFGQEMSPRRLRSKAALAQATGPYASGQQFRGSFGPSSLGRTSPGGNAMASRDLGIGTPGPFGAQGIGQQPMIPNTNDTPTGMGGPRVEPTMQPQDPRWQSSADPKHLGVGGGGFGNFTGQGMWQRSMGLPTFDIRSTSLRPAPGQEPRLPGVGDSIGFVDQARRSQSMANSTPQFQPTPQPGQIAPQGIAPAQSINLTTEQQNPWAGWYQRGQTGGGAPPPQGEAPPIGQGRRGLEGDGGGGGGVPPQGGTGSYSPGTSSVDQNWNNLVALLEQRFGIRVDANGNLWDGDRRVGNLWNDNILGKGVNPPGMSGDKYAQIGGDNHGPQDQDLLMALDRWRQSLGAQSANQAAAGQPGPYDALSKPTTPTLIGEDEVRETVNSMRRQLAFEQSKMLRYNSAVGARAGMSPGQQAGMTAEAGHRLSTAEAGREAQIKLQIAIQNHKARLHAIDQDLQNARMVAGFAHDTAMQQAATQRMSMLMQQQAQIQREMMEYEREQSQWAQVLGLVGQAAGAYFGGAYGGGIQGASAGAQIGGGFGTQLGGIVG